MKLLSISGENVGLLKGTFYFDFDPTLTTITGPIGCGKSTLVMMIKASLTNTLPGSASSWISWGCNTKAVSYFTVKWAHRDKILEVTKPLRDNAAFKTLGIPRLRICDAKGNILEDVADFRDTAECLHAIIQIPERVINTHLVVDQDSVVEPVNSTPAKFQEVLHNLTKMSEMEKVRAMCREAKTSYAIPEVQTQLEESRAEVNRLAGELGALNNQLEIAQKAFDAADYAGILLVIERLELAKINNARRKTLNVNKEQTVASIEALETKLISNKPTLEVMHKEISNKEEVVKSARVYLATLEDIKKRVTKRNELLEKAKNHVADKTTRTPLFDPPEVEALSADEYTNMEETWHAELSQLCFTKDSVQNRLTGHENGLCPTCGNDMTLTDEEVKEATKTLKETQNRLKEIDEEKARIANLKREWEEYELAKNKEAEWLIAWEERSVDLKSQLEDLKDLPTASEEEESRNKKVVHDYDQLVFQSQAISNAIIAAEAKLPTLEQQLEHINAQLSEIPDVEFVQADLDTANYLKQQAEKYQQQILTTKAVIKSQIKEHELAVRKMKTYEDRANQIEPIKAFRAILDRAIDILHRDNLPKIVTSLYMTELNDRLSYYLELIGAEFEAWISEELDFMVRKADGLEHRANRLSGGQKQQASVAYLLAVSDVFAHQLGVLILDEPTGAMQEENSRDMAEAFSQVINFSRQTDRQFVIVTHSPSLASYGANIEMADVQKLFSK